MERPRTGHGQHLAGSITVVDLIRRNTGPIRIPSAEERTTDEFVEDLLGPSADDARGRGRMARAARFVGLAVGSAVLCGSMIAASTLSHQRKTGPVRTVASAAPITGVGVLRPDTLQAQLRNHGTAVATPPPVPTTTATVRHSAGAAVKPAKPVTPAAAVVTTTVAPRTSSAAPTAESATEVVRDFYRLATSQPTSALGLLAPSLLSSDAGGFVQSWDTTRQVTVESAQAVPGAAGTVRTVVRMLQPDGDWLRVEELLHVRPGRTPVIDAAELLSAQLG